MSIDFGLGRALSPDLTLKTLILDKETQSHESAGTHGTQDIEWIMENYGNYKVFLMILLLSQSMETVEF